MGLDELGELVETDRAGVLTRLEQHPNLVLRQQGFDVNGGHRVHCVPRVTATLPLSTLLCPDHDGGNAEQRPFPVGTFGRATGVLDPHPAGTAHTR